MPKEIKINKEKEDHQKDKDKWRPSKEEQLKLSEFQTLFLKDKEIRDNDVQRYFNERSLELYLDDSQKRVNGYTEPRTSTEDWQVKYRNLLTRNKMLAILAKLATLRMKMRFKDKFGGGDRKKLRCFNALYNHYLDLDDGDMKQFQSMWTAWQDGTVVSWVTPEKVTKQINEIQSFDQETGEMETLKAILKKWKITSKIIPLQDIWFGNIQESDEQKQPRIWLRFLPNFQDFLQDWGKMPKSKNVVPTTTDTETDDTFYREENMKEDKVELLWSMNIWEDRMVVWGNKVELYDGPMPFGNKEGKFYPLALGVYEPIDPNFIYGKSGGDKLKPDQDMIDLFYRLLADRMIMQANPLIMNQGNNDLPEKIKMGPGDILEVDDLEGIKEFAFQDNTKDLINVLKVFIDSANQTSVESAPGGFARPNVTATADRIAEQSVKQLVGLFQFFMEHFMKKWASIFGKHILQGIRNPESVRAIITKNGDVEEFEADFGIFTERNVILGDGTRGDMVYKMVATSEELPSKEELDMREMLAEKQGSNIQYVYITPDYFDDFMAEVEPIVGSSLEQSDSLKRVMEVEFQKGFAAFFPEIFMQNQIEFAKEYTEVYEKDVDQLLGQGQQPQPTGMGDEQGGALAGMNTQTPSVRGNTDKGVPNELRLMNNL